MSSSKGCRKKAGRDAEACEIQQDETEQYGKLESLTKDVVEQWIDSTIWIKSKSLLITLFCDIKLQHTRIGKSSIVC